MDHTRILIQSSIEDLMEEGVIWEDDPNPAWLEIGHTVEATVGGDLDDCVDDEHTCRAKGCVARLIVVSQRYDADNDDTIFTLKLLEFGPDNDYQN